MDWFLIDMFSLLSKLWLMNASYDVWFRDDFEFVFVLVYFLELLGLCRNEYCV